MKHFRRLLTPFTFLLVLGCAGCADDDPSSVSNNPGVENPAAAAPNSIIAGVGTAGGGNGGGVTGGGTAPGH